MERREFLKSLIAAAVAQQLPIGMVEGQPALLPALAKVREVEVFAPYGMQFMVTREMVEDGKVLGFDNWLRIVDPNPIPGMDMVMVEYSDEYYEVYPELPRVDPPVEGVFLGGEDRIIEVHQWDSEFVNDRVPPL